MTDASSGVFSMGVVAAKTVEIAETLTVGVGSTLAAASASSLTKSGTNSAYEAWTTNGGVRRLIYEGSMDLPL